MVKLRLRETIMVNMQDELDGKVALVTGGARISVVLLLRNWPERASVVINSPSKRPGRGGRWY